jgi:hypothetical protein
VNGTPVTVTYSCSDGAGSGIASCTATDSLSGGGTTSVSSGGTITNSAVGNYTITVTAIDNAGNQTTSSIPYTVTTSSNTSLISSLNPSASGKLVTFTATVSSTNESTPTGTIEFFNGATLLATKTLHSGSAKYVTSQLPAGSDTITAQYSGDANNSASSAQLVQIVQAPTTVNLSSSLNPSVYYQSVTFSASVTSILGPPPDGETVTFKRGSLVLGNGNLSGGTAMFSISTLDAGDQKITAVYSGDTNLLKGTSETYSQVVTAATTTTNLDSSMNPSTYGQSVTFTATVTPEFGGTVSGSVTFMDGTKILKSVTLGEGGTASYTTTKLASGSHNITANYFSYNGGKNFSGSSASLTQTVQ